MAVQNFMQLQDIVLRERDDIKTLVYDIKDITISSDLLFISIFGRSLFLYQLPDTGVCGYNSFNGIGRLGALHFCYLYQFFQLLRLLL